MPFTVTCPCGTKVEPNPDLPEKRINCPNCGGVIFFMGLAATDGSGSSAEVETYGLTAAPKPPSDDEDVVAHETWLDRYRASPEAKKGEHQKTFALIEKLGSLSAEKDPVGAGLYLAVHNPDAEITVVSLLRAARSDVDVYSTVGTTFLAHIGSSEGASVPDLLNELKKAADDDERQTIYGCLQKIGPTPAAPVRDLVALLRSKHTPLFVWSVKCLGLIGPGAKVAVDDLLKLLKIPHKDLRLAIIDALGTIGRDPEHALPVLMQALKHQAPEYRLHAARALGRFGGAAREAALHLQTAAKDADESIRKAATEALQAISAAPKTASAPAAPQPAAPAAIDVHCGCGKKLRVKAELAGKKVKCPGCGGAVAVPRPVAPPPSAAPSTAGAEKTCPGCMATVPAAAVLCVHCGLDFRSGKKLAPHGNATATAAKAPH